jgi:hypothetical protein
MSRVKMISTACMTIFLLAGPRAGAFAQSAPAGEPARAGDCADFAKNLAGVWEAPVSRLEIGGALNLQVFGPGAVKQRSVELEIGAGGEGRLKVETAIVDGHGRKHAPTTIEATLSITPPASCSTDWFSPVVTALNAKSRHDDSDYQRTLEKADMTLTTDRAGSRINLWFSEPEGESFSETLTPRNRRSN